MATAVRSSASEVVAGTSGQRPGRSAGPQSSLGSSCSHPREWTDPIFWGETDGSLPEAVLLRLSMPAQHARTPCRAAHTLGNTYVLHAIQCTAHIRATFTRLRMPCVCCLSLPQENSGACADRVRRARSTSWSCRRARRWSWAKFLPINGRVCASVPRGASGFPRRAEPYLNEFPRGPSTPPATPAAGAWRRIFLLAAATTTPLHLADGAVAETAAAARPAWPPVCTSRER